MSSNVKVSGIPSHIKLGRLIPLFSDILSMRSSDFLMRILATKGPVNDILLSLPSYSDAQLAQEKLDNFVYKHDKITYVFNAELHGGYNQNTKKPLAKPKFKNQNQSYGRRQEEEYHRDRSRSPHYKDKSSELDMQLEILRKQRMILEEERKLLEEQKKLDELKRKSFGNQSPSVKRNYNEDVERCEQSSKSSKNNDPKQPNFHQACEVLVGKMKVFVYKYSSQEERAALFMHLRSIIKERLTMVDGADGQGFYPTSKVIKLYRSQYPPSEDEELVKQALEDVKEGRANSTEIVQAYVKGGNAKIKPDVTESAAGDSNDSKNIKDNAEEKVEKKFDGKRLYFFKSSGALMKRMRDLIDEYTTPETRKKLMEYLRYTLKQRLAAVVDGRPIYQTYKIVNLYREKHPPEDDEVLVKQLAKDIEEGRMPEDVMLKDKHKVNQASDEHESSILDNTTPEDKILTVEEITDKSDPPEIKEGVDISGKTENGENAEKNVDNKIIEPALENQDIEENKAKCTIEVGLEMNNGDKSNDNIENASSNDIVTDNIGKDDVNISDNNITGNDINTDVLATEANEKCSDNVTVNEDSHGVKRKIEEDENICIKLAKTDDVVVISCENTINKELEDN